MYVRDQPREKLTSQGKQNVSDEELLAIVLRTGSKGQNVYELAKQITQQKTLLQLSQFSLTDWQKIKGIGRDKAITIIAAFELGQRSITTAENINPSITQPHQVIPLITPIRSQKKEHFVVLYLNSRSQLITQETISIGTVDASIVHPREVFEPAIRCSASNIILAHNHPSDDCEASEADIHTTTRLIQSGKILGVNIIDHVIVSQKNFSSLRILVPELWQV